MCRNIDFVSKLINETTTKTNLGLLILALFFVMYKYRSLLIVPNTTTTTTNKTISSNTNKLKTHATFLKTYNAKHGYNTKLCFLVDMSIHCGKNRFFVYNLQGDSIEYAGLVAHGSGNKTFALKPAFSNVVNSGLTSLGKYKISDKYAGRFGAAYKLHGLDSSNNNAFSRFVVLHAYSCVPNAEPYPLPICNSLGCTMVSYQFLNALHKPIQ